MKFWKIKFPWSKPTGREVVEEIFSKFTPEEIALLDREDSWAPYMYSGVMLLADFHHTRRTMADVKRVAARHIYPLRGRLHEDWVPKEIFDVLCYGIFSSGEYLY